MQHTVWYLPVERYTSRWTEVVSGRHGMFADAAVDSGYSLALRVLAPHEDLLEIKQGVVLDTTARCDFAFAQTKMLVEAIQNGDITSDSVIYIEDFWHPGFEMIPYACHLKGIKPRVYAFCHAQSVDVHDFTHPMRDWMRGMERSWGGWLTGIFVAAEELRQLLLEGGIGRPSTVHTVGTVFHRKTLIDKVTAGGAAGKRKPRVLYASRLDSEKQPAQFLTLAQDVLARPACAEWEFVLCSGRPVPSVWKARARDAGVIVREQLTKIQYYELLAGSAVMFSSSLQDFVGYILLEALAYGCAPLYPRRGTYPAALNNADRLLYPPDTTPSSQCIALVNAQVKTQSLSAAFSRMPEMYALYGMKYEYSVRRMLDIMLAAPSLAAMIANGSSNDSATV